MTAPPEAMPPVPTVYVSTSVLFVVPAVAEVGPIEALPEPSALFDTATVLDGVVARVVTVPPETVFCWLSVGLCTGSCGPSLRTRGQTEPLKKKRWRLPSTSGVTVAG